MTHGEAVTAGDAGPGAGLQTGNGCGAAVSLALTLCRLSAWGPCTCMGAAGQLTQTPVPAGPLLSSQECDLGSASTCLCPVSSSEVAGVRAGSPLLG